jgi:hypothetical protein
MDQLDYMLSLQPGEAWLRVASGRVKFLDKLMAGDCGDTEVDAEAAT